MKYYQCRGLALFFLLLATGCSQWPPHGVGGMAERRPTQLPSPYDSPDNRHNIEKIIAYSKEVENKLHVIRPQLQQCMPGRLMQLDQQSILIHRELHARLWYDTLYNIDRLDKNIQQTTSDLNQLQQKTGCGKSAGYTLSKWSLL